MFGKYALLKPFARGGMGEIFLAAHGEVQGAEKLCLIKKVPEDRDSPGLTARLLDEAKVAVRLNHGNLVQVFDAGQVEDELYIAMELIDGRDLRAVWNRTAERRSRIPIDVALFVVREIARGLSYAHNYGGLNLVHRDIAPPNVLLSWHGEVKITDFGLARSILKNERTAPGIVYGRVAYLAPEQARGDTADARTDVFATGIILWELLTGRPMHSPGDDAVKNLEKARHPQIPAPSTLTRGISASLDQVVMHALATDRDKRYRSADEFRQAIGDELGRIAPGTDAARLSRFLEEQFGDDIKKEAQEHERLLREELPKLRARIAQSKIEVEERPRQPTFEVDESELMVTKQTPAPPKKPPPSMDWSPDTLDAKRSALPGMKPPPPMAQGLAATASLPVRPARSLVHDAEFDLTDDQKTRQRSTTPPSSIAELAANAEIATDLEADDSLVGELVDNRYKVLRLLGTGGMGAVYEAEHVEIGKKVALKVLHPQFSRQQDLVARFRREARAASRVGHPNIVDVTDSGTTEGGDVYFVMERLEGLDLGEVLRHERRVAADRAVHITIQICRALAAAHAAGIIHRDLKPENIFLCSRDGNADFVKVLDFGIAKQDMGNQNLPRRLTTPGVAMGTPEYMAPEQAAGKSIDGRVDIYAVGAMLYEMLTGDPPHGGQNAMEVITRKATEAPRPVRELNPNVAEPLEAVILSCLERDPDRRPQTMGALEYELNKSVKGRGLAVAAVLGIREETWGDEPSRPGRRITGVGVNTPPPMQAVPNTGSVPLDVRAAPDSQVPVASPDAVAETVEEQSFDLRDARRAGRSSLWSVLGGLAFLGVGAWLAWHYQPWKPKPIVHAPSLTTPVATKKGERTLLTNVPQPGDPPPKTTIPVEEDPHDERLSQAEISRLLEWARRTAEGGRIVSPPGDNLKELLDRVAKADPSNPEAQTLRKNTATVLARRAQISLKKNRVDDAVQSYQDLRALDAESKAATTGLQKALRIRAARQLERKRPQAALNDANAALEIDADDALARLLLADAYMAMGKNELAAEEYQRVLENRPNDKRAKLGLARAKAPKPPPKPVKKKKR